MDTQIFMVIGVFEEEEENWGLWLLWLSCWNIYEYCYLSREFLL